MWLERIERDGQSFVGVACTSDGHRSAIALTHLTDAIPILENTTRHQLTFNFARLIDTPATDFLSRIGFRHRVAPGHRVFQFKDGRRTVIVPALVLGASLFRSYSMFSDYLFRPQGLDLLCAPLVENHDFIDVRFLNKGVVCRAVVMPGIYEHFSWFYTYPSARRSWNSVYSYATLGKFALDLPKAEVTVSVKGKIDKNMLYVTSMTILSLHVLERPLPFATGQKQGFHFFPSGYIYPNNSFNRTAKNETVEPHLIPRSDGTWTLSNQEWKEIAPLFPIKRISSIKHHPRLILDVILEKLGTKITWDKLKHKTGNRSVAPTYLSWMRDDGRWRQVVAVLTRHRTSKKVAQSRSNGGTRQ